MRPRSAFKYIKENKGRSILIIFMFFLTVVLAVAGNYIESMNWYWERAFLYDDRAPMVGAVSSDEEFRDFEAVMKDLTEDSDLIVLRRSSLGYTGLDWKCTMGYEMGSVSYVVDNRDDLQKLFDRMGVECDLTNVGQRSVVMSKALAANRGLKLGDTLDSSVDSNITGKYTFDAMIDDDSFILFYVESNPDNSLRAYVMSDDLEGDALRSRIEDIIGDRNVMMSQSLRKAVTEQFAPFNLIFLASAFLVSIMLSVTVNSVLTGHYLKRLYEFGVYRAIGWTRRNVIGKVFCEIIVMDIIAILLGVAVMLLATFMLDQLVYMPSGQYLPYVSKIGIAGAVLSNILVVVPSMILQGRRMAKADVTEF